ncbi:hypothetical protein ACH5A3_28195 [Streptomyces echinatus]|uniref:hypothetical protein n=1 Tax=Streptomyces echinatus TaxID=67293 RepID=UPI003795E52D
MVFGSIWQGLQEWARTNVLGGTAGMSDEDLKAQAIQDPAQTRHLIAIETARAAQKLKLAAIAGMVLLLALAMLVGGALVVVQAAGHLKLPWARIGTVVGTFLGSGGLAGLVGWGMRRFLKRRRAAATPANPAPNAQQGDQNQVGTP